MRAEQDEVALQGIEFWSNVCDEEVDLQIEASEATEAGRPPEHVSRLEHRFTYISDSQGFPLNRCLIQLLLNIYLIQLLLRKKILTA